MEKTNNASPETIETIGCIITDQRDIINASNVIVLTITEEEIPLLIKIAKRSQLLIAFEFNRIRVM